MTRIISQASCVAGGAQPSCCSMPPGDTGCQPRQREKITMRIPPQVTERVKEAPAQALRAVFSGIGQVLLVADGIKSRATEPDRPRPASADPPAPSRPDAAPDVRDETRWRSLDETGNVR